MRQAGRVKNLVEKSRRDEMFIVMVAFLCLVSSVRSGM